MGTGWAGAGDEEGHVSSGRELTLQGAGKSWVGVLPSSDLGLVGRDGKRRMLRIWGRRLERERWEASPLVPLPKTTAEAIIIVQPS